MANRTDRLHLLEVFLSVLEHGSMTRAADALGVSRPTITRVIKELELTVGARLLQRDTHDLSATAAGNSFAKDARRIVREWQTLLTDHAGALRENKTLSIVAPIGLGQRILFDLVADHAMASRGLGIHWRLINGPIVFDREGCDLWVCLGPVADESLSVTAIGWLDTVVVASPACAIHDACERPESLDSLEMVALEPHFEDEIELVSEKGERVRVRPATRMVTNNFSSLLRAACRGLGFAVIPRLFAARELRTGELRVLLPGWQAERLPIQLVRAPSPLPRVALDDLITHLRVHVPRLEGVSAT